MGRLSSTSFYLPSGLSTRVGVTYASTLASSSGWYAQQAQCENVDLSTVTGAKCSCGKFFLGTDALPIKSMTLAEVRQVVASGYKLAHGTPLGQLKWK